ncbi:MAG: A/G-specific adenine glycosylase [Candidatus Aminicenantales bacterium]
MKKNRTAPALSRRPIGAGRERDGDFPRKLTSWYKAHHRKLPWREDADPYRIWISEIMLQQTTVRAVVPHYERWTRLFPDVGTLARAPLQKVLRAWQGLGYYQRARNIHRSARVLVRDHAGRVPDDEKILGGLPGFGPYTTAAVLSLAYARPLPVVDANVRRVVMRIMGLRGEASSRMDNMIRAYLRGVFPARGPGLFNQAMMELGALVCRGRNPQCLICPVQDACLAAREGTQEVIPRPGKRSTKKIAAAVAVIEDRGRFLIQKRPPSGLLAGLWEFPGGKIKGGESPEAALRREVREELGARVGHVRPLTIVRHAYTQYEVTLHVFSCRLEGPGPVTRPDRRWVSLRSVRRYPLPSGSVKIVDFLAARKTRI